MPFTPFHFGPGALIHAASPARISFLAFCAANVLIDIEPLIYMLTDNPPLHRFFHTFIGAALVAGSTVFLFALIKRLDARNWLPNYLDWKGVGTLPCVIGAALGTGTHILLDCILHADIRPFAPFSDVNPLLRVISLPQLEAGCLMAGAAGGAILGFRAYLARRRGGGSDE